LSSLRYPNLIQTAQLIDGFTPLLSGHDFRRTSPLAIKLLTWKHSSLSVDNKERIKSDDAQGRKQLARYMIPNPFSLEMMVYKAKQGVVVYRSKLHATLRRNYQLMPGA
jgi:hypothetical protein